MATYEIYSILRTTYDLPIYIFILYLYLFIIFIFQHFKTISHDTLLLHTLLLHTQQQQSTAWNSAALLPSLLLLLLLDTCIVIIIANPLPHANANHTRINPSPAHKFETSLLSRTPKNENCDDNVSLYDGKQ